MAGPETNFCRAVAECVGPAVAGNVAGFKAALRAIPCVPESLRRVESFVNQHGNKWSDLTSEATVENNIVGVDACSLGTAAGGTKTLSMTTYSTAVVRQFLQGLEQQLQEDGATALQAAAAVRIVGIHMNTAWVGQGCAARVLAKESGQQLKYDLDPTDQSRLYAGTRDKRSEQRRAVKRPSSRSARAPF